MVSRVDIAESQIRAIRKIFEREIQGIKDAATISELQRLIEANNVDGIIDLLGIDRSAFSDLEEGIREAYREGGTFTANDLSPIPVPNVGDVMFRFDLSSQNSTQWILQNAAQRVIEIVEDQRQMIRERISFAVSEGINPRQSALDLVGRIDSQTGRRRGGFIGTTSRQAQSIQNSRTELENLNSNYFNRELRDRRLDSQVRAAIDSGEPLSSRQIDAAVTSLQNRTLRFRAETISRTESINALRAGEAESIAQAVERGQVDPQDVSKEWDPTLDSRTREDHVAADGQRRPLSQPFQLADGSLLMYPGDSSLGAPAGQTIQCRCRSIYRIDFIGRAARTFRGFG